MGCAELFTLTLSERNTVINGVKSKV